MWKPEEKPKEASKNFNTFFVFLIGWKKAFRSLRTNHRKGSSLCQQKYLSRNSRANKTFEYSGLVSIELDRKAEAEQKEKKGFSIAMQVLLKVSVIFPDTKNFIDGKLGGECRK